MRRIVVLVFVVAATGFVAAPAIASPGQTSHTRFHGTYAEALWDVVTPTAVIEGTVTAAAASLFVAQTTARFDASGTFLGAISVSAEVQDGYSFALDTAKLSAASAIAENLPADRCAFDANGNLIGCRTVSISLAVSWTGHGLIAKQTSNERWKSCEVNYRYHSHGTTRDADATGTVDGVAFGSADVQFANVGTAKSGEAYFQVSNRC